jgi:hypothetical protein
VVGRCSDAGRFAGSLRKELKVPDPDPEETMIRANPGKQKQKGKQKAE